MSQAEAELREQTVDWTIKNFAREIQMNDVLNSQTFHFGETRFYLQLRWNRLVNLPGVALFLKIDTAFSQEINFAMGLKKCDGPFLKSMKRYQHGIGVHVKMSDILEDGDAVPAADGSVTFFCTLSTGDGPTKNDEGQTSSSVGSAEDASSKGTASYEYIKILAQNFKQLYVSGLHSDVTIKVEDREFQAHRCVLSARSPVFASMFQHEMAEKLSGVVDVADCDARCFEAFLLFLYAADISHVTLENAMGLYTIAEKYQVKELKEACVQFLKGHLQIETICDAVHLAVVHDETKLLETATEFFSRNTSAILATPQWKEFIVGNPLMANDLFIQKCK